MAPILIVLVALVVGCAPPSLITPDRSTARIPDPTATASSGNQEHASTDPESDRALQRTSATPVFPAGTSSPGRTPEMPSDVPLKIVEHGPRDRDRVALTFDADMTPNMQARLEAGVVPSWYNHDVIRVLESHKTPATLFLTGLWVESYPREARALAAAELFEIGNHSYQHFAFTPSCYGLPALPDAADASDIRRSQRIILEKTGETPSLFRFPGLCFDSYDADVVTANGLTIVQGDVHAGDGFNHDAQSIVEQVTRNVRNGSIVVMHMHGGPNAPKTADALELLIPELERNYALVTVSTLIDGDEP